MASSVDGQGNVLVWEDFTPSQQPPLAPTGTVRRYFDANTLRWRISISGQPYADMVRPGDHRDLAASVAQLSDRLARLADHVVASNPDSPLDL